MQYRSFTIPVYESETEAATDDLNRFLRTVRVLQVERQFHAQDRVWYLLVEYQEGTSGDNSGRGGRKHRIDYRAVLEPEQFVIFDRLRSWRKAQAEKEKIPAYAIFTNEQLAAISRLEQINKTGLSRIDGIGESRLEKYAEAIMALINDTQVAASADPEGKNHEAGR